MAQINQITKFDLRLVLCISSADCFDAFHRLHNNEETPNLVLIGTFGLKKLQSGILDESKMWADRELPHHQSTSRLKYSCRRRAWQQVTYRWSRGLVLPTSQWRSRTAPLSALLPWNCWAFQHSPVKRVKSPASFPWSRGGLTRPACSEIKVSTRWRLDRHSGSTTCQAALSWIWQAGKSMAGVMQVYCDDPYPQANTTNIFTVWQAPPESVLHLRDDQNDDEILLGIKTLWSLPRTNPSCVSSSQLPGCISLTNSTSRCLYFKYVINLN